MASRFRSAVRRALSGLLSGTAALLLTAAAVSAATTFGTSSITTTGTLQVDGNATFDTDTLFVDATNNKVGIGTVSPGSPLHVKQNAANSQILELARPQSSTDQGGYLFFRGGASAGVIRGYFGFTQTGGSATPTILSGSLDDAIALRSEGPVQFGSGGDNIRMTITSTGNVGIGDTTPAALFTVGSGDLFQVNSSGNVTTVGTLTAASSTANSDKLMLLANATGSNTFTGNLTTADLTAARSWSLPDLSGTLATLTGTETFTNKSLTNPKISGSLQDANGVAMLTFNQVTNAVNNFQMMNAVTTSDPVFSVIGSDANIDMRLQAKGSGNIFIQNTTANADYLVLQPQSAGSSSFIGTLTTADLTGSRAWTFPDTDGTVTVLGNSTTGTGNIVRATGPSLTGLSVTGNVQIFGNGTGALQLGGATPPVHVSSFQQTAPTASAGSITGTVGTGSTDTKGSVTSVISSSSGAIEVAFNQTYANAAPVCVISPGNPAAAFDVSKVHVTSTTQKLIINYASGAQATTQTWYYHCIE